jgi:hypothetical protein
VRRLGGSTGEREERGSGQGGERSRRQQRGPILHPLPRGRRLAVDDADVGRWIGEVAAVGRSGRGGAVEEEVPGRSWWQRCAVQGRRRACGAGEACVRAALGRRWAEQGRARHKYEV